MAQFQKVSLFLLRVGLGWLMFYAGITKVLDPAWTSAGYLRGAKTFSGLYAWFAETGLLPFTNFLNEWGLTVLGVALLLGAFVRTAGILSAALMMLYYFPVLTFPYIGEHSFLVDEHIIYALAFLVLSASRAGEIWGLESKYPFLRK